MSRKIFVIVAVYGGRFVPLSSSDYSYLSESSSDFVRISPVELNTLDQRIDVNEYTESERESDVSHYFKRRAQARRALVGVRDLWPSAELRIIEVGAYERNVRPVKQWQLLGAGSSDGGKTFRDWVHLDYFPLRAAARKDKEDSLSRQARLLSDNPGLLDVWKYKVVPVYAD